MSEFDTPPDFIWSDWIILCIKISSLNCLMHGCTPSGIVRRYKSVNLRPLVSAHQDGLKNWFWTFPSQTHLFFGPKSEKWGVHGRHIFIHSFSFRGAVHAGAVKRFRVDTRWRSDEDELLPECNYLILFLHRWQTGLAPAGQVHLASVLPPDCVGGTCVGCRAASHWPPACWFLSGGSLMRAPGSRTTDLSLKWLQAERPSSPIMPLKHLNQLWLSLHSGQLGGR